MNVDLDLKQVLSLMRKRWWLIAVITLLGTSAVGVYSAFFLKPVYQASTKLIVNSASDLSGFKLDLNLINSNISLISTYKEIIRTPAIMDLVSEHPELGVTSDELIRNIGFSSVNGTQVVTLTYPDHDYKKAARIVNEVSVVFQEEIPNIMKVDNVYLLNKADEDKQPAPFKPNKKLHTAAGFVLFLLIGIGTVLLLDFFDDSLKTEADVTAVLGLPTLIVIPKMKGMHEQSPNPPPDASKVAKDNKKAG
ncbi:Wzz/FepE/Etk N-terminal domain-containing protein [Cohnella sp. REN36]|uniref:YveK family protein n=1 Tax=Cohnella sp. REN36 TaxID=2887347 RepID=UPI001D150981|nr:lipopolysaccharide biosynthesis protein [Cohnella sp. REN36]